VFRAVRTRRACRRLRPAQVLVQVWPPQALPLRESARSGSGWEPGGGGGGGGGAAGGAGGFAAAGASAGGDAAAAAPPARTVAMRSPVETVPPLATCTFSITPLAVEGTSIEAFSDSSVTSGVSTSTLSPGFTSTSMTATSLKLPMSGTRTSSTGDALIGGSPSGLPRDRALRIDAESLDGAGDGLGVHALLVSQRLERRNRDVVAVDLEVPAQRRP
jgi:hypothetical protein